MCGSCIDDDQVVAAVAGEVARRTSRPACRRKLNPELRTPVDGVHVPTALETPGFD